MDFSLVRSYGIVWNDILFCYDAWLAYRKQAKKPSMDQFLNALQAMMEYESQPNAQKALSFDEELPHADPTDVTRIIVSHILEDASQLPFWAVKISAVVHAARYPELLVFNGWIPAFKLLVEKEGVLGLFRAFGPNMFVGLVENWRTISDEVAAAIESPIIVSRRSRTNLLQTPAQHTREAARRQQRSQQQQQQQQTSTNNTAGFLEHILKEFLLYPFRLVALRMVTGGVPVPAPIPSISAAAGATAATPSTSSGMGELAPVSAPSTETVLAGNSWLTAYMIYSREGGFWALYRGYSQSFILTLLPLGSLAALGLVKTFLYRGMIQQDSAGSVGGLLALLRGSIREKGVWDLFHYAMYSVYQVVPGFLAYLGAKLTVSVCLGRSRFRTRQQLRRIAFMEQQWQPPSPTHGQMVRGGSSTTFRRLAAEPAEQEANGSLRSMHRSTNLLSQIDQ